MHIIIMGVHFNHHHAICLSKLADWGPARCQPVGLIQDTPKKYASTPKFQTIGFLLVDLLVESLNSRDHDFSPWFTILSASMRCPPPGRSTVVEMWR